MIKIWLNIIRNLFSIFGILVFVSIILFLFFGETSKQRRNIFFETVKSFVGIGFKYDGFILIDSNQKKHVIGKPLKEDPINKDEKTISTLIEKSSLKT